MPSRFHCIVLKAFDQYERAGARVVLSERGMASIQDPKHKKQGLIELEAEEHEDGSLRVAGDDGEPVVGKDTREKLFGKDGLLVDGWKDKLEKCERKAPADRASRGAPRGNRQAAGPNNAR